MPEEKRIFVSYAPEEAHWFAQFATNILPYIRNARFIAWTDKDLKPGEKWEAVILREMREADLSVLLVTPDYIASRYFRNYRLPFLLKKKVFWIAFCKSAYEQTPLKDFQCANDPARPILGLMKTEADAAWAAIAQKLKEGLENP